METHERDFACVRDVFEGVKLNIDPAATAAIIPHAEEALARIALRDQLNIAGSEKIEKPGGGIRLPIRKMLKAILRFYGESRAAGHTWTMLHGAANNPKSLIIARDSVAAEDIKHRLGEAQISNAQVVSYTGLVEILAGEHARPLAFDNWALSGLFEMSLDEFDRLGGEIKKAIADWHRFQDFIVAESPEEMFRLTDAGKKRPNGVIEKFMAYLASLWNEMATIKRNIGRQTEEMRRATDLWKEISDALECEPESNYHTRPLEKINEMKARLDQQAQTIGFGLGLMMAFRALIKDALDSGFGIDIARAREVITTGKMDPEINERQFDDWFASYQSGQLIFDMSTGNEAAALRAAWNAARGVE